MKNMARKSDITFLHRHVPELMQAATAWLSVSNTIHLAIHLWPHVEQASEIGYSSMLVIQHDACNSVQVPENHSWPQMVPKPTVVAASV